MAGPLSNLTLETLPSLPTVTSTLTWPLMWRALAIGGYGRTPVLINCRGSSCDCATAAADGVEAAIGCASVVRGAGMFPLDTARDGAASGTCGAVFGAILDCVALFSVATVAAGFSTGAGLSG